MLPLGDRFRRRQAYAAGSEQRPFPCSAFNLTRDFGWAAQMINQKGMADGRFGGLERGLLKDRRIQRTPSGILAVRDQTVTRPERPSMRFPGGENRIRTENH